MNPVAVVTGAGSGIGRALALACGQRGMTVVVADVEEPAVQQLQALGVSCHAQVCDVAQASQVQALADASWAACGRVDWLFNNAGVAVLGPVWQATADDWAWVLGVNLMGVVHGVQAFVPRCWPRASPTRRATVRRHGPAPSRRRPRTSSACDAAWPTRPSPPPRWPRPRCRRSTAASST
ncbi:MAG: SDR family NAD(P)-dependent oxidoreductase [Rubrivivax sp.]